MCGYFAFISPNNKQYSHKEFKTAFDLLSHRGPDFSQIIQGETKNFCYQLGHHRLSIRDTSEKANQPFFSECRNYILLFNGEIYNVEDLKLKIKKKSFITTSDTEVLLYFLIENRSRFNQINGIYSFVFIDLKNQSVIISRDPIGVKPLYFATTSDGIFLSSEPKAIVNLESKLKKISNESVVNLIKYGYVGSENSFFKDIKSLPPGTTYKYSKNFLEMIDKIDINNLYDGLNSNNKFSQKNIEEDIRSAIQNQIISDVPISIWQSGGIDSTLINYVLKEENIKNFILRIPGDDFDESYYANLVSNDLNRQIVEIDWPNPEIIEEKFKKMVWHSDGEIADSSSIASLVLSENTSKHSKVVLSGDGGDEIFGGYTTYNATFLARYLKNLPKKITSMFCNFTDTLQKRYTRYSSYELINRFFTYSHLGEYAHSQWRRYTNIDLSKKIFMNDCLEINNQEIFFNEIRKYYDSLDNINSIKSKAQAVDLKFYLPSDMLIKTDRMAMAYGIEARVPLLDFNLIKKIYSYGKNNLNSNFTKTKPLLRKMTMNLGASKEIYNKKKTGFNINIDNSIDQLMDYKKKIFSNYEVFDGYFDINIIKNILSEHELKKRNHSYLLWSLMCFAQTRINFNI